MSSSIKTNPKQCFTKNKVFGFAPFGGIGGSRTPVRKQIHAPFYTLIQSFKSPAGHSD